jgi:hypothetical protein
MIKHASFSITSAHIARTGHGLMKDAHRHEFRYDPQPGYLYVRSRAISSRCNDNFDEFPAEEIKLAYQTFVGKPVFVNHHNADHRRARGVIVAAVLHEDRNADGSPDTWVEVLMEVDAINFPKLAQAIIAGEIDRTSMGTDVAYSKCSACGNRAVTPLDYCSHIRNSKGKTIRRKTATGEMKDELIREICYGLRFFENSLLVEEPADPTAYFLGVESGDDLVAQSRKTASKTAANEWPYPEEDDDEIEDYTSVPKESKVLVSDGVEAVVEHPDGSMSVMAARSAFVTAMTGNVWRTSTGMVHRIPTCRHINGEKITPVATEDISEARVVASYGPRACTTCFPSAPSRRTAYERKTRTPQWDDEDEQLHPRNKGKFTDGPRVSGEGDSGAPEAQGGSPQPQEAQQPQEGQEAPQEGAAAPKDRNYRPKPKPNPALDPEVVKSWVPQEGTTGSGSEEDPVHTASVDDAAMALALGLYVELDSPKQISTLLPELAEQIEQAKASGQDLKINLCNVTVEGTSLFCVESKGIPRVQMPQLKAFGIPEGTKAYTEGVHTDDGEIDIQPMFLQRLKDMGYAAEETTELAGNLKATQNELGGAKVAGITNAILNEGAAEKIGASPIFVSSDDYIVDGHHRWAGLVSADYADGDAEDLRMSVWRIDCDIITLLGLANEFAEEYGIPQQKMGSRKRPCTDCGPTIDEMNFHARRKMAR